MTLFFIIILYIIMVFSWIYYDLHHIHEGKDEDNSSKT